jgi:Na+/phosphate symporter
MASVDGFSKALRSRYVLAWLLGIAVVSIYLLLPDAQEQPSPESGKDEAGEEVDRLEIVSVSPPDPYPGSTLRISYAGLPEGAPLHVYSGKSELAVLAHRPGEVVASLPRELQPGVRKIRIMAGSAAEKLPRQLRSKTFHLRVKAPNYRKVFRNLIGGMALVVLGIRLMSRGVRESTGLDAARAVTRAARVRSVAYGFGALTGALVQSTTSAAGVLAALSSSGVLPLAPAGLAFLGAQCGAAVAPLLVTGFMEPREGLIAVAIGVLWLSLAIDRRAAALGRLVLGVGFVAFGLQLLRPALEPFVSDPMLIALADHLRADNALDVALCALIGSALVALLQGPAPLIVLMLAVAQTTGRWDLTTALALLSGTGLGAALAALLTASAGTQARLLARLHLILGGLSTLLTACTVTLWSGLSERLLGVQASSLGEVMRAPLHELGAPLALAFALSQLASALTIALFVRRLSARLLARELGHASLSKSGGVGADPARDHALASALAYVLERQQAGLDALAVLAQTGARSFGQKAEHALADARAALSKLVKGQLGEPSSEGGDGVSGAATFACLQLQHALETLLSRAERGTEARLQQAEVVQTAAPWDDQLVLRELHQLVSEGLSATRASLSSREPPDLDEARTREIKINRLESHARRMSHAAAASAPFIEQHLHMLQVIDAYEVVGNQVYRLTEAMEQSRGGLTA